METEIVVIQGDITTLTVDAVVNAANAGLKSGGGVDGAIHRAGGLTIQQECREIIQVEGSIETGEAVITGSGDMSSSFVIHTVGPIFDATRAAEMRMKLRMCYLNSLRLADQNQLTSIAFPNISTGVYGYPKQQAADVAIQAVQDYVKAGTGLKKICYVCFDRENYLIYSSMLS